MSSTIVENFILALAISLLGTLLGVVTKVTGIASNITDIALAQISASTAPLTRGAAANYGNGKRVRGDAVKVDINMISQTNCVLIHFNDPSVTAEDEYLCFGKLVVQDADPADSSIMVNGKAVKKAHYTVENNEVNAKPSLTSNQGTGISGTTVKNSEIYIPDEMYFYSYNVVNKSKANDFQGCAFSEAEE